MMGADFYFRNKIPVAILGVSEEMGQKLVQRLMSHPWFEIVALCDVESFVGQLYGDVMKGHLSFPLSDEVAHLPIQACEPSLPCSLIFSGFHFRSDSPLEILFAESGYQVISSSCYSAAEAMILNAEMLVKQGKIYW